MTGVGHRAGRGVRAAGRAKRKLGYSRDGALPGAKRDDAADGIVGRYADGDAVARHHLDPEPPHTSAELGQHFVASVALHSVETTRVNGHHRSLHVDQIVLAQIARPFFTRISNQCATGTAEGQASGVLRKFPRNYSARTADSTRSARAA